MKIVDRLHGFIFGADDEHQWEKGIFSSLHHGLRNEVQSPYTEAMRAHERCPVCGEEADYVDDNALHSDAERTMKCSQCNAEWVLYGEVRWTSYEVKSFDEDGGVVNNGGVNDEGFQTICWTHNNTNIVPLVTVGSNKIGRQAIVYDEINFSELKDAWQHIIEEIESNEGMFEVLDGEEIVAPLTSYVDYLAVVSYDKHAFERSFVQQKEQRLPMIDRSKVLVEDYMLSALHKLKNTSPVLVCPEIIRNYLLHYIEMSSLYGEMFCDESDYNEKVLRSLWVVFRSLYWVHIEYVMEVLDRYKETNLLQSTKNALRVTCYDRIEMLNQLQRFVEGSPSLGNVFDGLTDHIFASNPHIKARFFVEGKTHFGGEEE